MKQLHTREENANKVSDTGIVGNSADFINSTNVVRNDNIRRKRFGSNLEGMVVLFN